jgi:hypothetical protein
MTVLRKKGFWAAAAALCVVLSASQLSIAAGYQAKILCSAVFVSKRDPKTVLREDIAIHPLLHFIMPLSCVPYMGIGLGVQVPCRSTWRKLIAERQGRPLRGGV